MTPFLLVSQGQPPSNNVAMMSTVGPGYAQMITFQHPTHGKLYMWFQVGIQKVVSYMHAAVYVTVCVQSLCVLLSRSFVCLCYQLWLGVCVCAHVYMCVRAHLYFAFCVSVSVYTCMCVYTYMHVRAYFAFEHLCVCVYTHVRV